MYMRIARFLRANEVAEPDGGEADESKVQRVKVIPTLQRCVERGRATGDDAGNRAQIEHDPVHARFPLVQIHVVVVVENVR